MMHTRLADGKQVSAPSSEARPYKISDMDSQAWRAKSDLIASADTSMTNTKSIGEGVRNPVSCDGMMGRYNGVSRGGGCGAQYCSWTAKSTVPLLSSGLCK